jgi:hypothetical protein
MLKGGATMSFIPGQWVRLTGEPEWGLGQIQSVIGVRVTVNFENAGKRVVHTDAAQLMVVDPLDERKQ